MSTIQSGIENRLWSIADELRANSRLRASEYSTPVLGLIFLRYADHKFTQAEQEIREAASTGRRHFRIADQSAAYHARGVFYLPENARFQYLLNLPESEDIARAINDAMRAIEEANSGLDGVLPRTYNRLEKSVLIALLRGMAEIPMDIEGDVFGKIYEYFLGNFAMAEGAKGGEFFTPTSLVKLIVEIIQPFQGRILDPACGSGGMFVQSAEFIHNHQQNGNDQISIYGTERVAETIRLCKMNLAVHGLEGDIRQANSYYEDPHRCLDRFDFVMANPPFNVDRVDRERLRDDPRFPFSMPRVDNANYLWIQLFYSALNAFRTGRLCHGELRRRCPRFRIGNPQADYRIPRRRCDGEYLLQLLLHRYTALHPLVLRQVQTRERAVGSGTVHRCPPYVPAGRSGASGIHTHSRLSSSPTLRGYIEANLLKTNTTAQN